MTSSMIVFLALPIGLVLWGITLFNQLVMLKNNSDKAWSNIDVLLKQRNEELPKLIAVCKEHMAYEQKTLQAIVAARSQVQSAMNQQDMSALGHAEDQLRLGLGALFAVVEDYPELRASDAFMQLQSRITLLEDSIADRREFYNDSANINNTRIEQFPDLLIAKLFNFKAYRLMRFSPLEKQDIDIAQQFKQ